MPDQVAVTNAVLPFGVTQTVTSKVWFGLAAITSPTDPMTMLIARAIPAAIDRMRRSPSAVRIVHPHGLTSDGAAPALGASPPDHATSIRARNARGDHADDPISPADETH